MKIVFAGTPTFAAIALQALLDARASNQTEIIAAYTQPDRPAGRGNKVQMSAVKQCALVANIPVFQPEKLRSPEAQAVLTALNPDLMIVAAYGLILPQRVLDIPRFGCLNIHGSLLPRWRGAAPIQRAIEAGDTETGVGIMRMEAGLDTGAVLHELRTPISESDTAGDVHDRLAALGAQAMVDVVRRLSLGERIAEVVQSNEGIVYAHKILPEHARLDWTLSAAQLARKIRAFNPVPGCSAEIAGEVVKIWRATEVKLSGAPGAVLRATTDQFVVACGENSLRIEEIQRPGGKKIPAAQFLAGWRASV